MTELNQPLTREAHAYKPILSIEDVMQLLDCGRSNIYNLIEEGILVPHYFPNKNRRPYFLLEQIIGALKPGTKKS